jgi:hypothetical protein
MFAMDMMFVPFVFSSRHRWIPNSGFHLHIVWAEKGGLGKILTPVFATFGTGR